MTETPLKSRREEYAEATREALLDAARSLFVSEGYPRTGVDAIARAARVTRGAFYHHFADKTALFEALVTQLQAAALERVKAVSEGIADPGERIAAACAAFLDACVEPTYLRLVIEDAPAILGAAACRQIADRHAIGAMVEAIRKRQAAGQFDSPDPHLAAHMIAGMICEAAQLLSQARPGELKALRQRALQIVATTFQAFAPGGKPAKKRPG